MSFNIIPLSTMTLGIMSLGIMSLGIMTLGIMPLGIMTLGIMTLGIMLLSMMGQIFLPFVKANLMHFIADPNACKTITIIGFVIQLW